ncbi:MAG: hypothetical protein RIF33_13440 [Cyclobacteriaceae bacterium]
MSRYREISAYCFLLVFGIFIGHQLVPHHHHAPKDDHSHPQDQVVEHSHNHEHNASHHHHHDDTESANEETDLGGLLHNHSHLAETIDFVLVTSVQKHGPQLKLVADGYLNQSILSPEVFRLFQVEGLSDYPPPTTIQQIILANAHRRGPPYLV